jgi:hypothetical protein
MRSARRSSESHWEKRLFGHAQFLADEALAPDLFQRFAERFSADNPVTFAFLNYDRKWVSRKSIEPTFSGIRLTSPPSTRSRKA